MDLQINNYPRMHPEIKAGWQSPTFLSICIAMFINV